jgi:curli biogenesis system outer membrane secretion channel CsgG
MKTALNAVLALLAAASLGGCTNVPPSPFAGASATDKSAPCATCKSEVSGWSIAVTRPAVCNDYPVSYRVQGAEADVRVRSVERLQIVSEGGTSVPATAACCK